VHLGGCLLQPPLPNTSCPLLTHPRVAAGSRSGWHRLRDDNRSCERSRFNPPDPRMHQPAHPPARPLAPPPSTPPAGSSSSLYSSGVTGHGGFCGAPGGLPPTGNMSVTSSPPGAINSDHDRAQPCRMSARAHSSGSSSGSGRSSSSSSSSRQQN
jgi:hypothetical protein